ncbi:UDP-N-acetylmuramoyl-tripeptide--D-alanyl-D-alanine ligase [Candidatus Poribacteria bacterium]|nr:UDP-N-acetylmuramoyl-tripeptide--D-alanyl-D-alanine ligase [Candidatus Poribacteria bacterium]
MRAIHGLHILQLDGYKPARYTKWVINHISQCIEIRDLSIIIVFSIPVIIYPSFLEGNWTFPLFSIAWMIFQLYAITTRKKGEVKKPLVYTFRAKRLFGLSLFLIIGLSVIFGLFIQENRWRLLAFLFCELTIPIMIISAYLIWPVEQFINGWYMRDARHRIKSLKPTVIGITGSYGKTSTKYILHQILSQKYDTLMTPDSYNTPMGICKVIRGDLLPKHEYFIVEMGAYKRGDIQELCNLAFPNIGILTAVGPQHLERFKNIENTTKAKYELIQSLPSNGLAVINNDNSICEDLAEKTDSVPVVRYGVKSNDTNRLTAADIKQSEKGLSFTLQDNTSGTVEITTKLLGKHNVSNILAAVAVAQHCGMTLNEIRDALEALEPVPHRLQLMDSGTGITIIDDSFNANPEGAKAALEVLSDFLSNSTSQKVLVTPGLVELGEQEYDANKNFGSFAAKVCDFVILVGPTRTLPILDGLKNEDYPEDKIYIAKDLKDAQHQLSLRLSPGDVVLFENDLPDNYNEFV